MGNLVSMCNLQFFSLRNSSSTPSTTSSSSTPSSSITTHRKKYDVFLSFRGEDTRNGFISHLYDALNRSQIETFIDNQLIKGNDISSDLLRAINESKIAVIIFSKDYASSKWCLRELKEIMELYKLEKQIVMPVFYHVDPSDTRKQAGSFKKSFSKYRKENQEEVQKWKEALTGASNLSGWDSSVVRPESELVREIVENIWKKWMSQYMPSSSDFEGLIGIKERVERVLSLLCLDAMDFRIIGIWGMGGIGKTTIADIVFKLTSGQFEGHCFIQNVSEKCKDRVGLERLQDDLFSKLLEQGNLKLGTPTIPPFIKQRINWKKIIVVLDDVNDLINLEKLVGGRGLNTFGSGSKIILTSRDRQVLRNCGVDDHNICEVEGFDDDEALELFCNYAFKQKYPTEDLMELSKELVNYAGGNPLALKVLGSLLYGEKDKHVWESALKELRATPNSTIFDVLKISFEGLEPKEKELFLDIACFFNGLNEKYTTDTLDCKYSLDVLKKKSLITIVRGYIHMHGLLVEMGQEIVRRESPKMPGGCSRLWKREDVIRTLKNDSGTDKVEGILLKMHPFDQDIHLSSQVFDKMYNLRFCIFREVVLHHATTKLHLPHGLNYLSNELRIFKWRGYPLKVLPSNFVPKKLADLDLSYSNIEQLWEGSKLAPELRLLILNNCPYLTKIPDLLDSPLLEKVDLGSCKSLLEFPSSVQHLNNLHYLNLSGCINVTKFPLISENIEELYLSGTAIEEVPSSIQSLIKLRRLDLSKCTRLKHISTGICKLKSLKFLHFNGCSKVENFPEILKTMKIEQLNWLEQLDLSYRSGLLRELSLNDCNLMEIPEAIGCLYSLKDLKLCGNMFEGLPKSIKQLSNLGYLYLRGCNMLRSLTELPLGLNYLDAMNCKQLCQALPDASEFVCIITNGCVEFTFLYANCLKLNHKEVGNVIGESLLLMQQNTEKGFAKPPIQVNIIFPGSEIPEWFSYQNPGPSINIQILQHNLVNRKYMGFAVCGVIGFGSGENLIDESNLHLSVDSHFETSDGERENKGGYTCYIEFNHGVLIDSDHILLGYTLFPEVDCFQLENLLANHNDNVNMSFEFKAVSNNYLYTAYKVKYCAIHPIFEEPIKTCGGRRSQRCNDDEEVEVEPHPKKICRED